MGDLLGIGGSALSAAQKALELTGQNISNVSTPNYSRQRVDQSARASGGVSRLDTGSGVVVNGTQRLNDSLLEARLVRDGSEVARLTAFGDVASQIDGLLSSTSSGLATPLNQFFQGLQEIAADPSSTAARQSALGQLGALADRFNDLQTQIDDASTEVDQRLSAAVTSLNQNTATLAQLNNAIAIRGQNAPGDLLDQRDQVVQKIAGLIGISTVAQDDGSLNVFTSSGQPLVVGSQATALGTAADSYRPQRLDITVSGKSIGSQLGGGSIGGLLDARRNVLDPAAEKLGRVAVALTTRVNAVQAQGVGPDGQVGAPLFATINGEALPASSNTGSASATVALTSPEALTGEDYLLRFDGSQWQLTSARSGQAVAMTDSGTASNPFSAAGFSITVSGTAAAGDSLRIAPTHSAAAAVRSVASGTDAFAAAGRLNVSASLANTGTAKASAPVVTDASNPSLGSTAVVSFLSATTYQVGSGPVQNYAAGSAITANGWSLAITGTPAAGDSFTVKPTGAGSSDNRNANALAAIASEKLLDGGRTTVSGGNSALVSQIGTTAQQVSASKDAATAIQTQNQSQRDGVSGVNLDEEAANLMRYQQAYQAAAQVISTAGTVFEAVLAATRR